MALISGFCKQKCQWIKASSAEFDDFGQPAGEASQEIKCRWVSKVGWAQTVMGGVAANSETLQRYQHKVFIDGNKYPVAVGDKLMLDGTTGGTVVAVETIVGLNGKEEGRKAYVG